MLDLRELHRPKSPEEAVRAYLESEGAGLYVAGGTIVVPTGSPNLDYLVDLSGTGLAYVRGEGERGVVIGAMTTMTDLLTSPELRSPALAAVVEAAGEMGTHTVRNRATVGGNLYSAHFPSDLPPAFLVLGATVTLHGADGPREASLEDLYSKRAETYHKGDIITEVRVPASSGDLTSAFEKTGRTRIDVAILNCAAAVTVRDGSIVNARLALNGVSPAPLLVHEAMEFLAGKPCSVDVFEEAAGIVVRSVSPRGDHRASSAYRKKVAGVIAARVLSRASGVNQ